MLFLLPSFHHQTSLIFLIDVYGTLVIDPKVPTIDFTFASLYPITLKRREDK